MLSNNQQGNEMSDGDECYMYDMECKPWQTFS